MSSPADLQRTLDLAGLLDQERAPDSPVAWCSDGSGGDRTATWAEFRGAVAALREEIAVLPPGSLALATQDAFAFAIGLFACWHAGRVAVCPPNTQPGTMEALSDQVIGTVSDADLGVPGRPLLATDAGVGAPAAPSTPFGPLALDAPAIGLFTSGTTGSGKAIPKQLSHLASEVSALDAELAHLIGGAPTVGSGSHQHLYGMLFRVLWPLASGRPFDARVHLHAEELLPRLTAYGPCAFASVPAHLKRLAERDGLDRLAANCCEVFSSGGPLDAETARRWEQALGKAPLELFGSTETGGVAWRRQGTGPDATLAWTALDAVRVSRDEPDGRLRVQSAFVSLDDAGEGFVMGDRIEWENGVPGGRFLTLGRGDRVLKVGEKRLSLPEMEERLAEHVFVESAALLPLEQAGEQRVAAVAVLSEAGREALAVRGRRELTTDLVNPLADAWERVLLPRAWRFVDALPEDAQGKVTVTLLRALFEDGPAPEAAP